MHVYHTYILDYRPMQLCIYYIAYTLANIEATMLNDNLFVCLLFCIVVGFTNRTDNCHVGSKKPQGPWATNIIHKY